MKELISFLSLSVCLASCSASELFYFDFLEPLRYCLIEAVRALQWFKFVSKNCDDCVILLECAVHVQKIQEAEKKRSTTPPSVHWLDQDDYEKRPIKFLSTQELVSLKQNRHNNKKIQKVSDQLFPL